MKKAKIVLSAIAVFAVVGGAFAFKANRAANRFYTAPNATAPCTVSTLLPYTTSVIVGAPTIRTYASTAPAPQCPTRTLYFAD
jgi:hypothetical protein